MLLRVLIKSAPIHCVFFGMPRPSWNGLPLTINLLHWVPEGIVMCADSMVTHTSITPTGPVVTNFEHAVKLIALGKAAAPLPAAAMFNGQAVLVDEFVSVVIRQAGAQLQAAGAADSHTVVSTLKAAIDAVYRAKIGKLKAAYAEQWSKPEALAKINDERRKRGQEPADKVTPERVGIKNDPANQPGEDAYDLLIEYGLTVVVASYFGNSPSAIELAWPGARETDVLATYEKRLVWWGSGGVPVGRLMLGYDANRLRQSALSDTAAQTAQDFFSSNSLAFVMPVPMGAMPLQDAIDFSEYMGEVACGYDRFKAGPPTVGGELDILVLTPGTLEWVGHKEFHSKRHRATRSSR
ncbi:MAG: hypothetical protein JWL65_1535 [Gammaproteobacteria bacterium]|nr:hypothetical protein [Gammaproteobacteria bacterium]